jgi:class 3 adenylate cyclase/ABC-type nitrate/sulfonate/bicarbonate transport system substrate-binding protein
LAPGKPSSRAGAARLAGPLRVALAAAIACLVAAAPDDARARDPVTLQLKWKHQFQFAGYYAALERGFYRDAGFDVTIREGGPDVEPTEALLGGQADFAVCTTRVLRDWHAGRHAVALAAIFQHSPAIVMVLRRAGIARVSDLRGLSLMDAPDSDDVAAMMRREGVDYADLPRVAHDGDPRDLLAGRADAMIGYRTNEPFILAQLGVPFRSFAPAASGIDFYGDLLCAEQTQVQANRARVAAFRAATIKGWAYAVAHQEEIVDLILAKYSQAKSRDALLFEATRTASLVGHDPAEIGAQDLERWRRIAATYRELGYPVDPTVPKGLVWGDDRGRRLGPEVLTIMVAAGAALATLGWAAMRFRGALRRRILDRLRRLPFVAALERPRLSVIVALMFVGLSIPILIFILVYNYSRNEAAMVAMLNDAVAQTTRAGVERTQAIIDGVDGRLRLLAEVAAADPGAFRLEPSREVLHRILTSAPYIDAAYVSFEDGYHRVVTRIDEDRRRSDPAIPAAANWHSSYIDAVTDGLRRTRHRRFFDKWPHEVGAYDAPSDLDVAALPGYRQARDNRTLAVTEPAINPDTGFPILSLRIPIVSEGRFLGCASANLTIDVLSRFLDQNRASAGSVTFIADRVSAKVIAFPDPRKGVRVEDGRIRIATLDDIDDPDVREADRQRRLLGAAHFTFRSGASGRDLVASFADFPDGFGQPWVIVTLTPIDDFVGTLKATNRLMMAVIIALTIIELFFIYFASSRLASPVVSVSRQLQAIENLDFDTPPARRSSIREIAQLEAAASLLRTSLQSFASFVPLGVVRQLVSSGIPLAPGVKPCPLTIFFSDLENFSSHAERLHPDALLVQISAYLEEVSHAITQEGGTVDKFIGDGIMAFWGAPTAHPDHGLRGCAAALRAVRRMARLNAAWEGEGRPRIGLRIGLNSARVLVGNIGSSERLSYTALGDGVNVAARLEGLNKQFGTAICVSDSIVEEAGDRIVVRPLRRVQVKGRKTEFMVYELRGIRGSDDPELRPLRDDALLCARTAQASHCFEAGDRAAAARRYREILEAFPGDVVATFMLQACEVGAVSETVTA